jgi:hypothetical protein
MHFINSSMPQVLLYRSVFVADEQQPQHSSSSSRLSCDARLGLRSHWEGAHECHSAPKTQACPQWVLQCDTAVMASTSQSAGGVASVSLQAAGCSSPTQKNTCLQTRSLFPSSSEVLVGSTVVPSHCTGCGPNPPYLIPATAGLSL